MEIKRDVYLDKLIRVSVYQGSQDEAWDDYLVYGGLPLILTMEEAEDKADGKRGKKQLEVNFVATKGSEKYYIQSAFALPTADKVNQEQRGLLRISDFFRKIVVVGDNIKVRRDENGIITIGLRNFLLDENSHKL